VVWGLKVVSLLKVVWGLQVVWGLKVVPELKVVRGLKVVWGRVGTHGNRLSKCGGVGFSLEPERFLVGGLIARRHISRSVCSRRVPDRHNPPAVPTK
jgi:hypothetical protein